MKLTEPQLSFFETFGYLAFPGLMADCIDEIIAEFEALWESHGKGHNGKPHDGTARSCIFPFIDQLERLCALLDYPRIPGSPSRLLPDHFTYMANAANSHPRT